MSLCHSDHYVVLNVMHKRAVFLFDTEGQDQDKKKQKYRKDGDRETNRYYCMCQPSLFIARVVETSGRGGVVAPWAVLCVVATPRGPIGCLTIPAFFLFTTTS